MAEKDNAMKKLLNDSARFADFVNANAFHGKQVITQDMLEPMDISMITTIKNIKEGFKFIGKTRDVFKSIRWKDGSRTIIACIGIEGQNKADYTMVFRDMLYNSLAYLTLVERQRAQDKKDDEKILRSGEEYMCGLKKDQKLPPVATFIFYTGMKEWDAALSLYEVVDVPEELKPFISDYRINLVSGTDISSLDNYQGEMYNVIKLLHLIKNGNTEDAKGLVMDADVAQAASTLAGEKELAQFLTNKKGEVDMMTALDRVLAERAEERAKVIAEERAKVIAEERAKVIAEEQMRKEHEQMAINFVRKGFLTKASEIMEYFKVPSDVANAWYTKGINMR